MFENIKAVILDVDGTINDSNYQVPEEVVLSLKKLHDNGIILGLASGKSVEMQLKKDIVNKYHFDFEFDFLIGMNGSELWDNSQKESYSYYKLKGEWIREIVELMKPTGLEPYCIADGLTKALNEFPYVMLSSRRNGLPLRLYSEEEFCAKDTYKILYPTPLERADEVMEYISKNKTNDDYYAFKTQSTMIEFMDRRVNKGIALKAYCQMHDIDLKDVLAFGDEQNDEPFLTISGYSVCLLSGGEHTKQLCDAVTFKTCDEAGVADYLDKTMFRERGW